jgi:hypothetical protein
MWSDALPFSQICIDVCFRSQGIVLFQSRLGSTEVSQSVVDFFSTFRAGGSGIP